MTAPTIVDDFLPEAAWQPLIIPTQVIVHTAVDAPGPTDLQDYFEFHSKLESHYWITLDGSIKRMMPTDVGNCRRADANYRANKRPDGTGAISIETEDDGRPDLNPWTPAQIESIIYVIKLEADRHGFPTMRCRDSSDPGIGYHVMFGAPGPWTPKHKTCPGPLRIAQFEDVIMPAVAPVPVLIPPEFDPPFLVLPGTDIGIVSAYHPESGGSYLVSAAGHVYAMGCRSLGRNGAPQGKGYWLSNPERIAARIEEPTAAEKAAGHTYVIRSCWNERYRY